ERLLGKALEHEHSLADLLRRPGVGYDEAAQAEAIATAASASAAGPGSVGAAAGLVSRETRRAEWGQREADAVIEQCEIALKYAGYIEKQQDEVQRAAAYEHLRLPDDLDYGQVRALSFEVRQKLARHRPQTLGQAARVSGVTPAAVSLLLVHLKKARFKGFGGASVETGVTGVTGMTGGAPGASDDPGAGAFGPRPRPLPPAEDEAA
ncbi:MAG: hypothetical protein MUF03_15515, partial [Rubrivivax sp.]|nr:hypothetical protein [Rubrivivax sp.]